MQGEIKSSKSLKCRQAGRNAVGEKPRSINMAVRDPLNAFRVFSGVLLVYCQPLPRPLTERSRKDEQESKSGTLRTQLYLVYVQPSQQVKRMSYSGVVFALPLTECHADTRRKQEENADHDSHIRRRPAQI